MSTSWERYRPVAVNRVLIYYRSIPLWTGDAEMFLALGALSLPHAYIAGQRAIGADRLRYLCMDQLRLVPGDAVLDVGCGPGYYLPRLPPGVKYVGYDTSKRYIRYAQRHYMRDGIDFRCEAFSVETSDSTVSFTAAMLLGVLHHLPDSECNELLAAIRTRLTDDGCIISLDTCITSEGRTISRWMAKNDRGKFVRTPEGFNSLTGEIFTDVTGVTLNGVTRVPCSYWMMRMRA